MALLSRINAVCDLCKANRAFSSLRANLNYAVKPRGPQVSRPPLEGRPMTIFAIFRRPSAHKLKEQDNIPDEYQLIYRNTMSKYLLGAQFFSTVCACMVCLGVTLSNWDGLMRTLTWESGAANVENETIMFITGFIGFCTVLQLYVSRMPLRIYYLRRQKNYIVILYRSVPFTTRRIIFTGNQLMKLPPRGILPWKDNIYAIKDIQRVILIDYYFRKPADLNIMLGYQKEDDDEDEV